MATILVVDDDQQVRSMLCAMLQRAGYETEEAADGRFALEANRRRRADLIILDMLMPEMEGVETLRALRRADPDVKVIAISGGGSIRPEIYLESARKFGARCAFAKPVDRPELLAAIRGLLDPSPVPPAGQSQGWGTPGRPAVSNDPQR
ncbi:MAG: response regulator [Candidatus Eisenbacteria bacterium]